jgi:superfamily II DNA or RNA helicase
VEKGSRVLFIAHRAELIEQTSAKLDAIGVKHGIIMAGHWRSNNRAPVQLASIQTLVRRKFWLEKENWEFNLTIVDECHHNSSVSYQKVMTAMREKDVLLGLTATPYRTDGKPLGKDFNALVQVSDVRELTAAGYLVPARIFVSKKQPMLRGIGKVAGDYNQHDLGEAVDRAAIVGDILKTWLRNARERLTIGFAVNIAHGLHLTGLFKDAGIATEFICGKTPDEERSAILASWRIGVTRVVWNVGVFTEGFDMPEIGCLIAARPTMSRCLWRQMLGRALRILPETGKVDAMILDHAGLTRAHGFVDDNDVISLDGPMRAAQGPDEDQEPRIIICPLELCGAAFKPESRVWIGGKPHCPECGAPLPVRERKIVHEYENAELEEITHEKEAIGIERRQYAWREIASKTFINNWKPGAAGMRFKGMFGEWPRRNDFALSPHRIETVTGPDGVRITRWAHDEPVEQMEVAG